MKLSLFFLLVLLAGCVETSVADLETKIGKCKAAGMDYTYLTDFMGKPYDVMCVAKRLH